MFDMPPIPPAENELIPVTVECVQHSAEYYEVHPDILYAILLVERGEVGKTNEGVNRDNTRDIGPAQVNSIHLPELEKLGISEDELKRDGCLNVYVQARYLSIVLSQVKSIKTQDDYLYAIARYHNKDREIASAYVEKLKAAFQLMYQSSTGERK